jgi:hypothetical protein
MVRRGLAAARLRAPPGLRGSACGSSRTPGARAGGFFLSCLFLLCHKSFIRRHFDNVKIMLDDRIGQA